MNLIQLTKSFYRIGKQLVETSQDRRTVESLIFDLRAERTPGRFFEKLAVRIADYNKRIEGFKTTIPQEVMEKKVAGDEFYYLKAAILIGLINSLL